MTRFRNRDEIPSPICTSHEELVTEIANLCASLRWMVRLGFFLGPFVLAFGAYMTLQIGDIKRDIAVQSLKIQTVCEQVSAHIKESGGKK